ncbi:MAG: acetyl-CoA hydrolase/transferase C-terminal domain-containing protein [Oscillospiraceae bacterium]
MYNDRILSPELSSRVMSLSDAASLIKPGMTIALSGFSTGYPKAIPCEILRQGTAKDLKVFSGAAKGDGLLTAIAHSGMVSRFGAFQLGREMRKTINRGEIAYSDIHLSQLAHKLKNGTYGKIDFAIIECCKIKEDGGIVPSLSAGIVDAILDCADKVLLEVNLALPEEIEGMHDFCSDTKAPIVNILDRLGDTLLRCDPAKIAGIVITDLPEEEIHFRDTNELYLQIAKHVVAMIKKDIDAHRLPPNFTFQSGVGGVANAVLNGFNEGGFHDLNMYTEIMADQAFSFVKSGLVRAVTTTSLDLSTTALKEFYSDIPYYKERIVIRPQAVTNGASYIEAMGLVAMNTAVEADIYGNINSTNSLGSQILNGIGGSNDFCRSAELSIFITPSTAKNGAISSIVPMVTHVDNSEHDVDVIVTEYGYADLRGKSPKERVTEIIENCAHPDYRQGLRDYYAGALELCGPCQTPHDLENAFSWHLRYQKTGTMRV